jgi:nicotinate-nucleotide pyrophosphorylase (carboxylating)
MITRPVLQLIDLALAEDFGGGDITTWATIPEDTVSRAVVTAKEDLVLAGLPVFMRVFERIGEGISFSEVRKDGERIRAGEVIMRVSGPTRTLLSGERTALNFLMRLSGIATLTRYCAEKTAGKSVRITDTRKTTPGWRYLEKYAVRMGGGYNHRHSLSDGILIKDNHISAAGGIRVAVAAAKETAPHTSRIEVEVKNKEEISEAVESGADILLLDNMSPVEVSEAVVLVGGRALLEASGGITPETISRYAEIEGLDFISLGYLTHSARSVDINMKIELS